MKNTKVLIYVIVIFIMIYFVRLIFNSVDNVFVNASTFNLISSSENKVINEELVEYAKKNKLDIKIEYEDTQKIIKRLNNGEKFDGVWLSNSIWTYQLNTKKVNVKDTKSTSINPIIFGIKKSKAEELGFVGKDVYTKDIVDKVSSGKLKFTMSNPTTTNSGASAYLGILSTLAGNPEVLTKDILDDATLKGKIKAFFSGLQRSSGDEDFLEEAFLHGDYDAVFSYESSIININKQLEKEGKEILYAVYPIDGVSISDSPIGYIDNKNDKKKETYTKLTQYLLSDEGQALLAKYGRRTWYGGINENADKNVFNPAWGIDTTKYISPIKYPSTSVIKDALLLYQTELRKPVHVAFCLDYSGSMASYGYDKMVDAMDYILTDRASEEMLQFSKEDKIDVLAFASRVEEPWSTNSGTQIDSILKNITSKKASGGTALFPCVMDALDLLKDEDTNNYNVSVVVLTDGEGNVGYFSSLDNYYNNILKKEIPIYSIKFDDASPSQLKQMAELSNGRVFDGDVDLVEAFKEVRGYN